MASTTKRSSLPAADPRAAALAARVRRDADRLRRAYGRPRPRRELAPIDELILTILSQNTSDTNSERAFESLKRRFPRWAGAARASRPAIEAAIRQGGLSRIKSRTIVEVLRAVAAERPGFDLAFLGRLPVAEATAWLTRFRGVGEKTAACVLLFSLGRPAFPVDTHVHRVSRRLGWIPGDADAAVAHRSLAALVPPRRYYEVHVNLVTHGRRTCRARRPACESCPIRPECRHARRLFR
ncbi:MAG TPA: Fe-S cluster assembly protein HesB [Dongiaceae bacterium]|nr:Fe-S cluster assembly protein HesB [Dongiaceae bacterium]